jgi:2,3-dihydroxybenzoate decarboxylase
LSPPACHGFNGGDGASRVAYKACGKTTRKRDMLKKPNVPVIAIEEHYSDAELFALFQGLDASAPPHVIARCEDTGEGRLKDMDAAGIDIQVLSHTAPSMQKITSGAAELARRVNDRLAEIVKREPKRYAAFAALPTSDPAAAADELARCVEKLGFKGAMIHGLANGEFIDNQRYWPIFARAEALDVPIYLHPAMPQQAVVDTYYKEYAKDYPVLLRAAWGFTVETATLGVRLCLSGVFEKHTKLKFILGHLGEGLPFLMWRINNGLARPGQKPVQFRDLFSSHFSITTSGFFSDPALVLCVQEMGIDRILFSVDYPFEPNAPGTAWLERIPLCDEDKAKIASGNAKRLLRM